jgi:hypothetical protein
LGVTATYYELKAKIIALANAFREGDEDTRAQLRKTADFFPISSKPGDAKVIRSMVIRVKGEMFLVEDTLGGETGVFSLLLPFMSKTR